MFLTKASSLFQHQNQTQSTLESSPFENLRDKCCQSIILELGKTKLSQSSVLSLTGSQQNTSFPLYKNTSDMFSKISLIYTNNPQLTKLTYHKMKSRLLESLTRDKRIYMISWYIQTSSPQPTTYQKHISNNEQF